MTKIGNDCYVTFCPIAKACEILEPRWTLLILCEMWQGSTHFNDIRRGVPAISPTLLTKRLRDLETHGLVERCGERGSGTYHLTAIANELQPIVDQLANWSHRHIDTEVRLERLDARVLMWNMRRKVNSAVLPRHRLCVIQFIFRDLPEAERNYWIISRPGFPIDLCSLDPGHDVSLYVTAELRALTSAWMGYSTLAAEMDRGAVELIGDEQLMNSIGDWMVRSRFAA